MLKAGECVEVAALNGLEDACGHVSR